MPVSQTFLEDVMARMAAVRPVEAKKMFGGAGFYLEGAFFAVADDDRLFFRVDSESAADYGEDAGRWEVAPESYREVPDWLWDDPERLGAFMDRAALSRQKRPPKRRKG